MTDLPELSFIQPDLDGLAEAEGRIVVFLPETGKLDQMARRVNRLTRGALERFAESEDFAKLKEGDVHTLGYPSGLAARAVDVVRLDRRIRGIRARRAGGLIGKRAGGDPITICAGSLRPLYDICLGVCLGAYRFDRHVTTGTDGDTALGGLTVLTTRPDEAEQEGAAARAAAEAVWFARDLVNEPANVLTTTEFADRLAGMEALGLSVEVLDEDALHETGMRALLAVGQGSASPSKVVIMSWTGAGKSQAPVALLGKGVVFDTGGISLKPAAGMEAMTMDMGGGATVAGVMRLLALRKARINAVGVVGLVENMPDGGAMRPGDILKTHQGDTVEVNNTDAEGRLVLADILSYTADRFKPFAMVDLATLTGAVVVALGHHNAGLFSTDGRMARALLGAAEAEGEGLWQLPLGEDYARQLKSNVADLKNSAGRPGGAVTAAEFLRRFVPEDMAWAHIDIAGVTTSSADVALAPKGATGWGVLTLDRWLRDEHED
ncbi:leucyl aminopeptidase [Alphaproteobacteria bacterium GH1-50]|uniref:Probable cytosol aminopeptidase n=1 Tax=Kangsaoukella pontilimi TaxID=2691042 RepID=A0A7C9MQM4_9RHOB|nr:leucyl aminopeptidase [Kangsaoukella pontilimi]MXQ07537.1 leucyl aminopeptidase [Kangsaoukella pontilimi]